MKKSKSAYEFTLDCVKSDLGNVKLLLDNDKFEPALDLSKTIVNAIIWLMENKEKKD